MVFAVSTKSAGALYWRNRPGTPTGKKYALLASVKSTLPHLAAVLLEQDAGVLERAARLALAQELAIEPALIRLLDLGVGDHVVVEVGAADGLDILVGLRAESGPGLARTSSTIAFCVPADLPFRVPARLAAFTVSAR
jgi:hypothetical protein